MQSGQIVFTGMERVIFGQAAAEAVAGEAERLGAERVFLLVSGTLNRETDAVDRMADALGPRYAGRWDHIPSHSPREAVVGCANAAREAGCDLLVSFGGGSATDGGKAATICLQHGITKAAGLEPFRTVVDENGERHFPDYEAPQIRQIVVPTTLSGGEFNARAGITNSVEKLKQSYMHPGIIPISVILDAAATVHTPEWLWLSTGIRAVDHAVETYCSLDANDYTDGAALQALRLLSAGLARVKADPGDLEARQKCLMGAWISMTGVVTGTRLGASHAIGHILGGTANVPHGYTSCVMLPYVMDYNAAINSNLQADIAAALGQPKASAGDALDKLISGLGMPRTLREVDISEEELPQLAENCMLDTWTFSNPRKIRSPDQVMEILRAAF
ncbi:MAG: iron-containing alcohol dehydrogenase [Alphaproteobacteria bacterium]|jgi:maleylacetate reductase|nr:alcohol dehydrogenase [Rhodospirillaceae bacterium]MDP6019982.1 iron-containing alcohol dehydrogenase [Alphaproteobacteria bacterium]MDP6256140.1 iron-containing alcohol dehydrogenase [Alphaproteobacteria bacterium]MDP7055414.1 iron-containing alcohol dehydrogenase [Alphaproteobacteria bacterium]MDP7228649.1 iron-containing alcohol dehydrogenase [Alphaproteobacteria bacterium]|tara:strand:+ start:3652 stop:4821 length:1170 start_codon:yes stop_codon:yes gene_type:complete